MSVAFNWNVQNWDPQRWQRMNAKLDELEQNAESFDNEVRSWRDLEERHDSLDKDIRKAAGKLATNRQQLASVNDDMAMVSQRRIPQRFVGRSLAHIRATLSTHRSLLMEVIPNLERDLVRLRWDKDHLPPLPPFRTLDYYTRIRGFLRDAEEIYRYVCNLLRYTKDGEVVSFATRLQDVTVNVLGAYFEFREPWSEARAKIKRAFEQQM